MYKRIKNNPNSIAFLSIIIVVAAFAIASFVLAYPRLFFSTVVFETNYGTPVDAIAVRYGDSLDITPHTEREYNTFGGWFFDKDHQKPYKGEPIKGDITLYAKWDTIFTKSFFTNYSNRLASAYGESISVFNMYFNDIRDMEEIYLGLELGGYDNLNIFMCGGISPHSDETVLCIAFILESLEAADNFYKELIETKRYYFDNGNFTYIRKDVLHLLVPVGNENTFLGTISENEDFVFAANEADTELTIMRYKKDADEITIPEAHNGLPISGIGAYAFYDKSLSTINLNDNLKYIGKDAFAYCKNLGELSVPRGIELLANGFITGAENLRTIELNGAKNYEIYEGALYDNRYKSLVKYIGDDVPTYTVREGTINIGDYAFSDRGRLASINLPDSLIMICGGAFSGCYSLSEVDIPENVIEIGVWAFSCSGEGQPSALRRITFAAGSNLQVINAGSFANNPNLDNIVIPNKLNGIELGAFANCTGLTNISFQEGSIMEFIFDEAFANCSALTEIYLPDSINIIYANAFIGCNALERIDINKVTNLYKGAFANLQRLKTVTFAQDSKLKEIPQNCFQNCPNLANIVLPPSLEVIDSEAFAFCIALQTIDLGMVKEVGHWAFYNCANLKEVLFSDSLDTIQSSVFDGCTGITKMVLPPKSFDYGFGFLYGMESLEEISMPIFIDDDNYNTAAHYFGAVNAPSTLTKITINNNTVEIPAWFFKDLSSVTEIILPDSVVTIGNNAFNRCSALVNINVPTNLKVIKDHAFADCASLASFPLPAGLQEIGVSAFKDNVLLNNIEFPQGLKRLEGNAFSGCALITHVILPDGMESVGYNVFEGCIDIEEMRIPLDVGNEGNNRFPQFVTSYCTTPEFGDKLKKVTLSQDTSVVPSFAFRRLAELETIDLPNSLVRISDYAFHGIPKLKKLDISMTSNYGVQLFWDCDSLQELTLNMLDNYDKETPSYLNYFFTVKGGNYSDDEQFTLRKLVIKSKNVNFGARAFVGAKGLQEIVLPATLTKISQEMFMGCVSLESVNLPSNIDTIENKAFQHSGIKEIVLPTKINTLGQSAFADCASLETVALPRDTWLYNIGEGVFANCVSLRSITFPNRTIWQIPSNMFDNCTSLQMFDIPEGVQHIEEAAFRNSGIKKVSIPSTVISIDWYAFEHCAELEEIVFEQINISMVKTIGRRAFAECRLLQRVVLPPSLTEIVGSAFENCVSLREVYVLREFNYHLAYNVMCTNLLQMGDDDGAFANCNADLKIYVPLNNAGITEDNPETGAINGVTAYKTFALGWPLYKDIVFAIPEGFEP